MASWSLLMLLGTISVVAGIELSAEVTHLQVGNHYDCPGDTLALICSVHSVFVEWECDDGHSRTVLCAEGNILPLECHDQNVNITVECDTSEEKIEQSTATLIIPTNPTTLTCEDDTSTKRTKRVPVQPLPVQNLQLNSTVESTDDSNLQIATISWNESIIGLQEIYKITIKPAVQGCNSTCETDKTHMELKLATGIAYNVTIITVVCNGSLQSPRSAPLSILLNGSTVEGPPDIHVVVLSTVPLVLLLLLLLVVVSLIIGCSLRRVARNSQRQMNVQDLEAAQQRDQIQEQEIVQRRFYAIQAAFEASIPTTGRSLLKLEAGRSVVCGSCIYYASYDTETMFCYSVDSNVWKRIEESMQNTNPGLGIINGYVATFGGKNNKLPSRQVWLWKDHQWIQYEDMIHRRSDPAVVTSSDHKYVVVINGNILSGYNIAATSSVEVCDVKESSWKAVCSLPSPHTRVEVTLCKDTVYIFADQYLVGYKCSLKALTENQNANWEKISGLPLRLSTPTTLEDCIICVGGASYENFGLNDIYIYDQSTDSWMKMEKGLEKGRMYSMVEVYEKKVIVVGGMFELTPSRHIAKRIDKVEIFSLSCDT